MRVAPVLLFCALSACAAPPRAAAPARDGEPPPGVRPGAFSWREVRGGQDKIEAFQDLRDRALSLFEEAARFPGRGGAPSPAARALPDVRASFDETRAPDQLEARVVYFDRTPAAEGIEVRLLRRDRAAGPLALTITIEDVALGDAVDGRADRLSIRWEPAALAIEIEPEEDGSGLVQRVRVAAAAAAEDAEYRVTSPHLASLLARAQETLYEPLSGPAFARVVREGSAPLLIRPAPPRGTSFAPAPGEESPP